MWFDALWSDHDTYKFSLSTSSSIDKSFNEFRGICGGKSQGVVTFRRMCSDSDDLRNTNKNIRGDYKVKIMSVKLCLLA